MSLDALVAWDDPTNVPLLQNFRSYGQELKQTFFDQPNVGRMAAPYVKPAAFDGITEHETTTYDDVDDVEYGMVPGESNTDLQGDTVKTKMPQIYKTARDLVDNWRRAFGPSNQGRQPILMGRLRQKVLNKEDYIIFNGDLKESIEGMVAAGHGITTAGSWATADSQGIRTNMKKDFYNIRNYFSNVGLGKYKIDYFITYPAYDLMDDVDLGARASSMMDLITGKSYFGELMPSNNVRPEAPVDGKNVLIGIPRVEVSEAFWGLISSGIEDEALRDSLWTWIYGIREKFSVEFVLPQYIAVVEDITLV